LPAQPARKNRFEHRAVRTTVAPPAIHETRSHPPGRAATVASVAVHGAEDLSAIGDDCGIGRYWILDLDARRLAATRSDVIGIADGHGHSAGVRTLTGSDQRQDHARRTTHDARFHTHDAPRTTYGLTGRRSRPCLP